MRKFQEELFYSLGKHERILLRAPTGSGKTFTLIVSLLKTLDSGIPVTGIYPSKALVYDQYESLKNTLLRMGFSNNGDHFIGKIKVDGINGLPQIEKDVKLRIVRLTADTKKEVFQSLENFFPNPSELLLVLTVPEYPYMYLSALGKSQYFSQLIEMVMKGERAINVSKAPFLNLLNDFSRFFNGYFFIDEFHLYNGIERSSLNVLIDMVEFYWRYTPTRHSIVFSSATPTSITVDKTITADTGKGNSMIRKRTKVVFHLVLGGKRSSTSDQNTSNYSLGNPQEALVNYITSMGQQPEKKTGIILDRVYYIAELCSKINWSDVALIWGLDQSYGKCVKKDVGRDSRVIVGNSAVSFGIDIPDLDLGFITSNDPETLIQRFGRFGRVNKGSVGGQTAEVHIFVEASKRVIDALQGANGKELTYEEFIQLINKMYQERIYDELDSLEFSRLREKVIFDTFLLVYNIANGELAYTTVNENWRDIDTRINIRPSSEDYFNVFAFRPGGIEGNICENPGKEDFFTLLRNFRYSSEGDCFQLSQPLKEYPYLLLDNLNGIEECKITTFQDFINKASHPNIVLVKNGIIKTRPRDIEALKYTYVIPITKKCIKWGNFSSMARYVASYAPALTICVGDLREYCSDPKALLLFV
ncbi:ATP-dependent helicase [Sulfolobus sp. A20]|uniref:DEAD/DEAH box helicase n=1 Tax=Sulfolobus sp. B1 TaxID=2200888 RepID=UPI000863B9A2|nr:DEAD/DEAH box helicase [Sulfolobus sp. B1]AOL17543.1 ATP-dependent helicase [Sulfolobus sp. A20]